MPAVAYVQAVRCACLAAIASALLVLPATAVHEAAHMAACLAENPGADWRMELDMDGARGWCPGVQNLLAYYASGGLAAAAATAAALLLPQVRRRRFLHTAVLAVSAWQLATAAVETLAHAWYVTSGLWQWSMPAVFVAVAAALCLRQYPQPRATSLSNDSG